MVRRLRNLSNGSLVLRLSTPARCLNMRRAARSPSPLKCAFWFDQGTPVPLRLALTQHEVSTAFERNWATLKNGELLDAAESIGFDVLVTTDMNLRYQQNLTGRRIAIVVLSTPSWPRIQHAIDEIVNAVNVAMPASYAEITIR